MKIKYLASILIPVITLFSSCVDEDVIFKDSSSINFERRLHSIADDTNSDFTLNLIFRDSESNIVNDQSDFVIEYSSDNPEILTIDNQGIITITPNEEGLASKNLATTSVATIRVNASLGDFVFDEITDEIIVGKVTISESEALIFTEERLAEIVNNGYEPTVTITNPIREIGIASVDTIQFNAVYQNLKNEIEDVDLVWTSSDSNIIDINSEGVIKPLSVGQSIITASFNDNETISEDLIITVTEEDVEIIVEEPVIIEPEVTREIIGFGMLQSNSSYTVEGNFQIIRENGISTLILDETYSTGNVPDLVIYLSNVTNTNNGASFISEEITSSGEQSFIIPDSINPDDYSNVLIFCRQFGVRVGFGIINR